LTKSRRNLRIQDKNSELAENNKMGHSHDHGSCEHESDGIDPLEMGVQYSLFQKIDMNNLGKKKQTPTKQKT
jgi:hypothetical protein